MLNERLRQARLIAGMTQGQVVSRLGTQGISLTKAGLSKYERGGSAPPPHILMKLARILSINTDYLLREPSANTEWIAYRKQSNLGKKQREQIQAYAAGIIEGQIWLQEKLYPQSKPSFPKVVAATTHQAAESAAMALRTYWKIEEFPIESVANLIEDHGGMVVEHPFAADEFHGLSGWTNNKYPVTIVNSSAPDDRKRFSLAHELGHLMMDCGNVDPKTEESLAHRFAAAFIVPPAVARRELGERRRKLSFQELAVLKEKHGLSIQAWIRRALDLGIIDDGHYRTLFVQLSSRRWRKKEPFGFKGEERPYKLKQMTLRALAEGIITPAKAETLCPGCINTDKDSDTGRKDMSMSPSQIMKLPKDERDRILAASAEAAKDEYLSNADLTSFDAFEEEDWVDE